MACQVLAVKVCYAFQRGLLLDEKPADPLSQRCALIHEQSPVVRLESRALTTRTSGRCLRGNRTLVRLVRTSHATAAPVCQHLTELRPPDISEGAISAESQECRKTGHAPLVETLRECGKQETAAFHFPGHRRGGAAPPDLAALFGDSVFRHDLPELPELDNLFAPDGVLRDAQARAAHLFHADDTLFLVNGSTCGIQAAVMATCVCGDYLVLPRNSHMCAVSGMVLSGAVPKYVMPAYDSLWGIAHGIQAPAVEAAISEVRRQGGRVGAVLLVSPTYFGVCSDVASIAATCHRHGIPLIVDEAHGAHFRFDERLPPAALEQGADVAVQSTHKVLGSLTQSAMLHLKGSRVSKKRVSRCLQVLQSSSPSYLLLSSLDAARAHMSVQGSTALSAAVVVAQDARHALMQIPGIQVLDEERVHSVTETGRLDPLRITLGLWDLGITGFQADDILRLEDGVIAELPLLLSITFALSAGTTRDDIRKLVQAIKSLSSRFLGRRSPSTHQNGLQLAASAAEGWRCTQQVSPREAFFAESESVRVENCVGRVCAELLCPYPPGIPVIAPGEIISAVAVDQLTAILQAGGSISGASDSSLSTILVVQR